MTKAEIVLRFANSNEFAALSDRDKGTAFTRLLAELDPMGRGSPLDEDSIRFVFTDGSVIYVDREGDVQIPS